MSRILALQTLLVSMPSGPQYDDASQYSLFYCSGQSNNCEI